MKNLKIPIMVGLSVNPIFSFSGIDIPGKEKGSLTSRLFELSGSTVNIAQCLVSLGLNPTIIAPFEFGQWSQDAKILDFLLDEVQIPHVRLKVLNKTPFAVSPEVNGKSPGLSIFYGEKGYVTNEELILSDAEKKISSLDGLFRIAAGIDKHLVRLASKLLGENEGGRSFSPHHSLCSDPGQLSNLKNLFLQSDEIKVNEQEFISLGVSFEEIHKLGVKLITVTKGEKGGVFSLCNETTSGGFLQGSYDAVKPKVSELHLEGAGDCFNASTLGLIIKNGLSFKTINFNQVKEVCNFGAQVASMKITVKGGSNYNGLSLSF